MSTTDKYLTYRGDLKAVAGVGGSLLLVTTHAEGQPTALYRLDADKLSLAADPLPAGGVDLVTDGETAWVAGADRRVYRLGVAGGKPAAVGPELDAPPAALALLSDGRLAVAAGQTIHILGAKDGKSRQAIELPEPGTCLAADPTGNWLVAGTSKGTVAVFDCEDKPQFLMSESAKLHEGAVSAVLFERDDLRFFSAGADGKLLSTHARGELEPEDKGRGNNHADLVTALLWAPGGERFLSGGRDSTIKSWPRAGGTKPATQKDGVAKVVGLALVQVHNRTLLAAACADNTVRLFPLDAAGKIGDLSHRVHGAAAWAKHELAQDEPGRREAALRALAEWNDTASIEQVAEQAGRDADHGLRLLAGQLLSASAHPRAAKLLERLLTHGDEAVRVAALTGLRKHLGEADLRPLDLALAAEKPDVGRLAVGGLENLASTDDQALARLTQALDAKTPEVRQAALSSLERVYDPKSPDASLLALGARAPDLRRRALVRLLHRGMLADPRVQSSLRRAAEDADAEVRRTAFLLSLYTRERLLAVLRARDPELERQLAELESADQDGKSGTTQVAAERKEAKPAKGKAAKAKETATPGGGLDAADFDPLLQATASRALDTCLRGARGLAVLRDERALGLLLQLSREQDAAARAEVARALAALDDPRGVGRLRSLLFDADATVRDAAFTALERLHDADPLKAADAGLGAGHDDVRRRGLQAVIAAARKSPPKSADDPAWPLLIRALNDAAPAVRTEAFKAALNLQVGGGGVNTLRFVLQSVHADVRREVLTEAMAQSGPGGQPWAWGLLLDFLGDPAAKLREEAFEFATKKSKGLDPLQSALKSRHPDVRRRAVEALVKKHTNAAQALLATALADEDKEVRGKALDALIADDVRDALRAALESPHDDVHARAARALARHGDSAALRPLVALASAPQPEGTERQAEWAKLAETALDGLAELGDPDALPHVLPLLDSPKDAVRKAAGWALAWVAMDKHPGALRQAMQHADPQVKYQAALGLALGGEASAAPLVFSPEGAKVLPAKERLTAAVALGPAGEDQIVAFLDHSDERARAHAIILLMLLELKTSGGVPSRCLACLASRDPRVRLRAARGLDSFRDPDLFLQFVTRLIDDRGDDEKPRDVPPETVDAIAELIAFGAPPARARTARVLGRLFKEEAGAWDRAWAAHEGRYGPHVGNLRKAAAARKPAPPQYAPEQLEELAFGAYVGLVREQGGSYSAKDRAAVEPHVPRVRQTALTWLMELTRRDAKYAKPARAVFVQALGDPIQGVRVQAFEQLQSLGMDPTALGAEALASGHTDLGVRGLQLLSSTAAGGKASAQGEAVLEQAMLARTDDLAIEAAKLLIARRGQVPVAAAALAAAHEPVRDRAVEWLVEKHDTDPTAGEHLRRAMQSRYAGLRDRAAKALAWKKDPAAFEPLVAMLHKADDTYVLMSIADALYSLGDPRTAAAVLDRIENDAAGAIKPDALRTLFTAVSMTGGADVVDRLLALAGRDRKLRDRAWDAVRGISGYSQPIEDPEDERPDQGWLTRQRPRRADLFARLVDHMLTAGVAPKLLELLPGARWAPGGDVEPVLSRLVAHPDDKVRHIAAEAAAWRLRKRSGPAEPLLAALSHRDPVTQFIAAEGLARAGRGEGMSVLLSAVDFMTDLSLRKRAVQALGELGDARALDLLLRLAGEDGHALQEDAAEAIGHLGKSDAGDDIFKLLGRLASRGGPVSGPALRGLRWLGTAAAWRFIREHVDQTIAPWGDTALGLLGYNDDPATRDLLLRVITRDALIENVRAAFGSAQRLWGAASLEPHYAWLQNPLAGDFEDGESLRRVAGEGDPRRVFEILPRCPDEVKEPLSTGLLRRQPPPAKEAEAALASNEAATVRVAARILGRAGSSTKTAAAALSGAIDKWQRTWDDRRRRMAEAYDTDDELTGQTTPTVEALLWAAGRLGVAQDAIVAAALAHADDSHFRPIRLTALAALAAGKPAGAAVSALEAAATGADPDARALAADALADAAPARAAKIAAAVLPDRVGFNRMLAGGVTVDAGDTLRTAASQPQYQGIVLPHLVARGEVDALAAAAGNRALPVPTRAGAVEGLGRIATEAAEARLRAIGMDEKEDEELRKAAWRALRRSKRARQERAREVPAGAEVKA